jgi:hypothetical protein
MTAIPLVLLGMAIFAMAVSAIRSTRHVKAILAKPHARTHLPRIISTLVLTVQFSELLKVVNHVSITHVVGALLLLAVMIATKAGTEGELIP